MAPAGYGKTSLCKWGALYDGERFAKGESNVIPVYVPLHRFAQALPNSFEEAFLNESNIAQILKERQSASSTVRMRLYLDGLDEVPVSRQRIIAQVARQGSKRFVGMQIVLTARDHVSGPWLGCFPRLHLSKLDDDKIVKLVRQLLNEDKEREGEFFRQLALVPSLKSLMGIPLLSKLTAAVFVGMTTLPDGRMELYRIFIDLMCGGWDMAKGLKREGVFPSTVKQRILSQLAIRLHHSRTREGTPNLLRNIVKEVAKEYLRDWESLVGDLVQDGLLVREGKAYVFSHLSFQEYLCARDLVDPGTPDPHDTVREYLRGDDWWREVVLFYFAMSKKPHGLDDLLEVLREDILRDKTNITPQAVLDERIGFLRKTMWETVSVASHNAAPSSQAASGS